MAKSLLVHFAGRRARRQYLSDRNAANHAYMAELEKLASMETGDDIKAYIEARIELVRCVSIMEARSHYLATCVNNGDAHGAWWITEGHDAALVAIRPSKKTDKEMFVEALEDARQQGVDIQNILQLCGPWADPYRV